MIKYPESLRCHRTIIANFEILSPLSILEIHLISFHYHVTGTIYKDVLDGR